MARGFFSELNMNNDRLLRYVTTNYHGKTKGELFRLEAAAYNALRDRGLLDLVMGRDELIVSSPSKVGIKHVEPNYSLEIMTTKSGVVRAPPIQEYKVVRRGGGHHRISPRVFAESKPRKPTMTEAEYDRKRNEVMDEILAKYNGRNLRELREGNPTLYRKGSRYGVILPLVSEGKLIKGKRS